MICVFPLSSLSHTSTYSFFISQDDNGCAFITFIGILFGFSLYYLVIKDKQTLSPEEDKILFIGHVVNSNIRKNRKTKKWFDFIFFRASAKSLMRQSLTFTQKGNSNNHGLGSSVHIGSSVQSQLHSDTDKENDRSTTLTPVVLPYEEEQSERSISFGSFLPEIHTVSIDEQNLNLLYDEAVACERHLVLDGDIQYRQSFNIQSRVSFGVGIVTD